jgi:hypothetical protein
MLNVIINAKVSYYFDGSDPSGKLKVNLVFNPANSAYYDFQGAAGLIDTVADHPNGIFSSVQDAIDYFAPTKIAAMVSNLNGGSLSSFIAFSEGTASFIEEFARAEIQGKQDLISPIDEIEDAEEDLADVTAKLNNLFSLLKGKGLMENA